MDVVQMDIKDIKPYEKNPRINDNAVDAVANSIREFGFKQPIVVDKDNVIIAGHTRWKAAKKLKLKTVPVIVASDLTDEQVRAYRIADNSTGELAWCSFHTPLRIFRQVWMGMVREGESGKRVHPTQKPVRTLAEIIDKFSEKNDTILDVFGGSGSTMIACEEIDRKCLMMELDPHYCDVIIDRWEQYTGRKAEKVVG